MSVFPIFRSLSNPVFLRLYAAQTVSLLGDALTWVGLALLAFKLAGNQSALVLSTALTLRVITFVVVSPLAGAIADRFDRKYLLAGAHVARMAVVGLLPWMTAVWQLYGLILALNIGNALFTPTYKATIPLVTDSEDYPQAIALASATGQLLGVIGPGIAGGVAAFLGLKQVFYLDALSFLIAALLIITLPNQLRASEYPAPKWTIAAAWQDIRVGTNLLWGQPQLRYALGMQLVAAIAGAQILVNTVGYVQGELGLSSVHYGWVMAAFGMGAFLFTSGVAMMNTPSCRLQFIGWGAVLMSVALLPASHAGWFALMGLWVLAGGGESWINVPTQTLIADYIPVPFQGRVYGAHFAWSHLWWVLAYPLASWLETHPWHLPLLALPQTHGFLAGGLISLGIMLGVQLTLRKETTAQPLAPDLSPATVVLPFLNGKH